MGVQLGTGSMRFILFGLLALTSTNSVLTEICLNEVPQDCDPKAVHDASFNRSVKYYLFTQKNTEIPEVLHKCEGTLPRNTNFNPKRRMVAVIMGLISVHCHMSVFNDIKDEFLKKGDYNVLFVDTREAFGSIYKRDPRNLPKIAEEIARVFQNIQNQTGIPNDMIDLVGNSLGAQLAGLITYYFKVKRITGIDPNAVPLKENVPRDLRLKDIDADLVDILHCDAGGNLDYPSGHADFFIQGAKIMTSCEDILEKLEKEGDLFAARFLRSNGAPVCANVICLYYYMKSINNKFGPFKARLCDSYPNFQDGKCDKVQPVTMGVDFDKDFASEIKNPWPRKYYLNTTKYWPNLIDDLHDHAVKMRWSRHN